MDYIYSIAGWFVDFFSDRDFFERVHEMILWLFEALFAIAGFIIMLALFALLIGIAGLILYGIYRSIELWSEKHDKKIMGK